MNLNKMPQLPLGGRIFVLTGPNGSGKTRALALMVSANMKGMVSGSEGVSRIICLSGSVLDRFPRRQSGEDYAYFGRRTNTNMFSEIAPYRRLADFLMADCLNWDGRAKIAKQLLESISLGAVVKFKFRRGRNTKEKNSRQLFEDLDISIDLSLPFSQQQNCRARLTQLNEKKVHVAGVSFLKNEQSFDIADLSSGERSYALSVLAMAFSVVDKSLVIFDEPENSLHPKWQESIVRDLWMAISAISNESRLIIATHSPLVLAGAKNRLTYVLDLARDDRWSHSEMYGNTSDTVLRERFGMRSPRTISFLNLVQECLKTMVEINTKPEPFREAADRLLEADVRLDEDDPLFMAVERIKEAKGGLS